MFNLLYIASLKKENGKDCSNYRATIVIFHASEMMLKILQQRVQPYMEQTLPAYQRISEENPFVLYRLKQSFDGVEHEIWIILKEMVVH